MHKNEFKNFKSFNGVSAVYYFGIIYLYLPYVDSIYIYICVHDVSFYNEIRLNQSTFGKHSGYYMRQIFLYAVSFSNLLTFLAERRVDK